MQEFLGFEFTQSGDVKINIAKKEFEKGFKKIVEDIVQKVVDSRTLNTEEDRRHYLENFPKSATPRKRKGSKALSSKDFTEVKLRKAKIRRKLAPKDIIFTLKAPGISRMLEELQSIDYRKFPNAAHDLLRSFLECSLKVYFREKKLKLSKRNGQKFVYLDDVLKQFKDLMESQGNRSLAQVTQKIKSNKNMKSYTSEFLNATNHNPDFFVIGEEVKDAWDTMESLFRFILDPK